MVTYNGWIEIWADIDGESDELIEPKLKQISVFITEHAINESNVSIKAINGIHFMQLVGHTNRYHQGVENILGLIHFVAKIAVGSHGLLYFRDEDNEEKYNEYIVYRIARGKVTQFKDTFLSPCNPTIEE